MLQTYRSVSQHPTCHVPQSFLEGYIRVVWEEVRGRAVADQHIRAGPHNSRRLVAGVESGEPKGLRLAPPRRVGVILDVKVLVADGVEHIGGQNAVGLCKQPCNLPRTNQDVFK